MSLCEEWLLSVRDISIVPIRKVVPTLIAFHKVLCDLKKVSPCSWMSDLVQVPLFQDLTVRSLKGSTFTPVFLLSWRWGRRVGVCI